MRNERSFKDFIKYFSSIWGILSFLTLLFPLSNLFFETIPISVALNKNMHIAFATLLSTFIIFILYTIKEHVWYITHIDKERIPRRDIKNNRILIIIPFSSVTLGIIFLVLHFIFSTPTVAEWFFSSPLNTPNMFNLISSLLYSMFYVSLTLAFTFLALVEYMEKP